MIQIESPVRVGGTVFHGPVSLGAFTYFNHSCEVHHADIGRFCSIGQGALIGPGEHAPGYLSTHPFAADSSGFSCNMATDRTFNAWKLTGCSNPQPVGGRVKIGNDVWIGARAIVLQGVEIGNGAIIAGGAIVTRNVEDFSIVAGVPARHLRYRFTPEICEQIRQSEWWNYDLSQLRSRDFSDPPVFLAQLAAAKAAGLPRWSPVMKEVERSSMT